MIPSRVSGSDQSGMCGFGLRIKTDSEENYFYSGFSPHLISWPFVFASVRLFLI